MYAGSVHCLAALPLMVVLSADDRYHSRFHTQSVHAIAIAIADVSCILVNRTMLVRDSATETDRTWRRGWVRTLPARDRIGRRSMRSYRANLDRAVSPWLQRSTVTAAAGECLGLKYCLQAAVMRIVEMTRS